MHRTLLLRGARQLITMRGAEGPRRGAACLDLGIITDGSILIRDGRIASVGHSRRIDNLAEARHVDVYEAHGVVVMPGLVDAQAVMPENNGVLRRLLTLALAHGTTALAGIGSYATLRGVEEENQGKLSILPTLQVDGGTEEAQVKRAARRNLAQFLRLDLLAHTREELRFFHGMGAAIRAMTPEKENPDWVGLALAYGAEALELAGPLDDAQITLLADSATNSIVTPGYTGAARDLLDRGAALALGSGFRAGFPGTCSMVGAALQTVREGGLQLAEALTMSTINAAHALGVAGVCGSLEAGKQANLILLHVPDYRELDQYAGVNVVSKVFQAGTLVK
ncbi:MAG: amidohydrolase family protein [Bryobacterales bacterium]|nr:amidohydrolase family protein [Bryobacterales bacterium]